MRNTVIVVLAALAGLASANLLVNGDFEQPIDVGWADTAVNAAGSATFTRSDTLGQLRLAQPDRGCPGCESFPDF
jgi:hypothetical protein